MKGSSDWSSVVARRCQAVRAEDARHVVAGYIVVNDVSVRDWQFASPTMTMGKSWDTHGPTGPWMVTSDELRNPHDLILRTWVDGELRQQSSTALMISDCWQIVAHISMAMALLPGTIIATGTPAGVGYAMEPPLLLSPGSTVMVEIEGLGTLDNPVIAEPADFASADRRDSADRNAAVASRSRRAEP